jgi:hypothetical protein
MAAGTGKRRALTLMLAAALAVTATGCSSLWERSYESVTTHVQQSTAAEDPDVLRAEDYSSLVNSLLHFVSQGDTTGTVRLYQYTGDVESDLESACQEVLTEDPLGSYALRKIEHSYNRIVSYYECTFTFQYRRDWSEVQSISTVRSTVALREWVQQSMDSFETVVALRLDFPVEESAIREMVRSYYYNTPSLALGYPTLYFSAYPNEEATQKIVELRFDYSASAAILEEQRKTVLTEGEALTEGCTGDREGLWEVYHRLSTQMTWDESGSDSLYDLLTGKTGNSESFSLAMLLACQSLGIDCQVIEGTRDGQTCWWNQITLDGETYELDVTAQEEETGFLHTPEEMAVTYQWEDRPAAESDAQGETAEEAPNETTE